jgi:uncharacterized protein
MTRSARWSRRARPDRPDTDPVISAGATITREAVALGPPVLRTFEGWLGGVDEAPLSEGRLRRLEDPSQVKMKRRSK